MGLFLWIVIFLVGFGLVASFRSIVGLLGLSPVVTLGRCLGLLGLVGFACLVGLGSSSAACLTSRLCLCLCAILLLVSAVGCSLLLLGCCLLVSSLQLIWLWAMGSHVLIFFCFPLLCCLMHLCLVPGGGFVSEAQLGLFSFGRGCWASCLLLQLRYVAPSGMLLLPVVVACSCFGLLLVLMRLAWLVAVLLGGLVLRLLLCVADVVAVSPFLC